MGTKCKFWTNENHWVWMMMQMRKKCVSKIYSVSVFYLFRQDVCRKWSTAGCECAEFVFLWKSCWTHRCIACSFAKFLQHTKRSFWLTLKNVLLNMNFEILNCHKWRTHVQMKRKACKKCTFKESIFLRTLSFPYLWSALVMLCCLWCGRKLLVIYFCLSSSFQACLGLFLS